MSKKTTSITRLVCTLLASTLLTLFIITLIRHKVVENRLELARRYAENGRNDRAMRELRLAYMWSHDFPHLRQHVKPLYQKVANETGRSPEVPRSRLTSSLEIVLAPMAAIISQFSSSSFPRATVSTSDPPPSPALERTAERKDRTITSSPESTERQRAQQAQRETRQARATSGMPRQPSSPAGRQTDTSVQRQEDSIAPQPPIDKEEDDDFFAEPDMWAVVTTHNAPLFNREGTRLRALPAGSVLDVQSLRSVSGNDIVLGSVWSRVGNFPNIVMRQSDIEVYYGRKLSETSREQRELASRRAELLASIQVREHQLKTGGKENPHRREYLNILRSYRDIETEAERLKAQFDEASGSHRMDLANRLRILNNEQTQLMPQYRDIKEKMDRWEQRQIERYGQIDPESDPAIQRLRRELEEVTLEFESM